MNNFEIILLMLSMLISGIVIGQNITLRTVKRQKQLIEAYLNYILFLQNYIGRKESYLRIHRMGATTEEIEEGERLRNIIFKLKEEIK